MQKYCLSEAVGGASLFFAGDIFEVLSIFFVSFELLVLFFQEKRTEQKNKS